MYSLNTSNLPNLYTTTVHLLYLFLFVCYTSVNAQQKTDAFYELIVEGESLLPKTSFTALDSMSTVIEKRFNDTYPDSIKASSIWL